MDHEFPLDVNWNSTFVDILTAHALSIMLVLGAIGCVSLQKQRPPKDSSIWFWAFAMAGSLIAFSMIAASLRTRSPLADNSFFTGYKTMFWCVGLRGMWVTHYRLKTINQVTSFCFVSLNLLFLLFIVNINATSLGTPRYVRFRNDCRNNLRRVGLALHNFHADHENLPAPRTGEPPVSWRIHALPYLDNHELFKNYDQTIAWDSDKNNVIAEQNIQHLTCPSNAITKDARDRWYTHYAMIDGKQTIGDHQGPMSFTDFTDGTSNTLLVVEAAGLNIVWTEPRDSEVFDDNLGVNLTGPTPTTSTAVISAWHRGGGHALLADGTSVFYILASIRLSSKP